MAAFKFKREIRPVGVLSDNTLTFLRSKGLNPPSGVIAIQDREVIRFAQSNHPDRLSIDDIASLPRLLRHPKVVIYEKNSRLLHYIWDIMGRQDGWVGKVIVNPLFVVSGYVPGRKERITTDVNSIRKGRYVRLKDFYDATAMEIVEGML